MDLSRARIVGYFGSEPIYHFDDGNDGPGSTPPPPPQQQQAPSLPERYIDGPHEADQPNGDTFCITCLVNNFIDVVEEHIDPFLDRCKARLQQLGQIRIDSDETALHVMTERKDLLKKLAFGSEVSTNLKALILTAAKVFGTEAR